MMPSNSFFSGAVLALAAGAAAKSVSTTPHDKYSSSVGVLGCKIDTNRVAYWPGSVDCDNFCVKLSMGSRSVHLLHIDQSQGAYDISYDAWVYLQTGQSATKKPISGGGVAMEYEYVDASECAHLFKTDGAKVPLSASNSMNFLASCLEQPSSYIAKNHELYNICDAICSMGHDEKCKLDLAVSNQPSCGNTLGLTTALTSAPVWDIQFSTGKKVLAGGGDGAPVYAGPGDDEEEDDTEEEDDSNNNPGYTAPVVSKPAPKPKPTTEAYVAPKPTTEAYVAPEPTTEAYVAPEPTTEAYVAPEPTTEPYVAPVPTTTEAVVVPEPTYEEPAAEPATTTTSKAHKHGHKHGHGHKHTKAKPQTTSTVDDHVFQEVPSSSTTEPEPTTKAKKVQATSSAAKPTKSAVYSAATSIVSSVTAPSTPEGTPSAPTVVPANAGQRGAQVSFGVLASAAVLVVCSLVM